MRPGRKADDNRKNARDRNVSASSANARNKAEVAAKNVVAANKADDKPGYLGKRSGGSCLPPLFFSVDHVNCRRYRFHGTY
jgi:hypothetical protein